MLLVHGAIHTLTRILAFSGTAATLEALPCGMPGSNSDNASVRQAAEPAKVRDGLILVQSTTAGTY